MSRPSVVEQQDNDGAVNSQVEEFGATMIGTGMRLVAPLHPNLPRELSTIDALLAATALQFKLVS